MSSTQYISKFSGVEIDRAVAYYNSTASQRVSLTVTPTWLSTAGDENPPAKYKTIITLSGSYSIANGGLTMPEVYFKDNSGTRWDIEYKWATSGSGNNITQTLTCYSNTNQKTGEIVISTTISDVDVTATVDQVAT